MIDSLFPLKPILGELKQFIEDHKETEFNLSVEYLSGAMERILEGDADFAVTLINEPHSHLETLFLINVNLIPVAAPSFPPAQKDGELSNAEMEQYIQILARDSSHHPRQNDSLYLTNTSRFLEGGRHWAANNNTTKKDYVMAGLGWGRLPTHFILEELLNGSLVPLNIESIKPIKAEIQLVRQKTRPVGPIAAKLWTNMQQWSQEIIDYDKKIEHILTPIYENLPSR